MAEAGKNFYTCLINQKKGAPVMALLEVTNIKKIYSTAKGIDLVVCFMSQNLTDSGAAQASIAQDARLIYGYYNE